MPVTINGTTGIAGVDGSNTTPAIKGGTSTGTGVFYGTNTVSLATGGTTAVTVDSSQNVGIGTASPAFKLDVSGAINSTISGKSAQLNAAGGSIYASFADGTKTWRIGTGIQSAGLFSLYNATDAITAFNVDSSGNLLVGTTSATATANIGVRALATGYLASTLAGSTSATDTLNVYSTGASAFRFYVNMAGTVYATSTTISGISDVRLKENIEDIGVGLNEILSLKPRKFDWKEGKGKDIKGDRGFIAQEFEQVFPDLIDEWKDEAPEGEEPYKSVRQELVPVLVKAIQELSAKLDAAEARIAALEAK